MIGKIGSVGPQVERGLFGLAVRHLRNILIDVKSTINTSLKSEMPSLSRDWDPLSNLLHMLGI
jgi:hypothetical protein